jgi:hypothetical protein
MHTKMVRYERVISVSRVLLEYEPECKPISPILPISEPPSLG